MGFLHTKRRNRLNYSKVLWMAQIRGNQIDEDSSEFNALLENQIHPADNDDAKWDLTTLFKFGLEVPGFFYVLP
ncbi:unnamed protein product [Rhizophagus irregularis]|uniref:Uncharacterized protein n=1 Tax=Rhizophagus irregularis TaxID=588596 RepID=A0A915ZZ34_9GLOM|nr:unnamed protein product [Rhizophagus irregularis]CAB5392724.1 unnamed protein product [Rhizophagus irregularis]